MSTFTVEIVPVELLPHPDPDTTSLSIVKVFDGYTVCVRTEDWLGVTQAAYIPPESVVPNNDQYAFLKGHLVIKARKFRGVQSYGMLVPAPQGSHIGENVAWQLGIVHYEPELSEEVRKAQKAFQETPPTNCGYIYDIESWHKYRNQFSDGECVTVTEKIHGQNSRYTFQDDKLHIGSHYNWVKYGQNSFSYALDENPWIEKLCRANPGLIVFGEIYGPIQKGFPYDSTLETRYRFRVFDLFKDGRFLSDCEWEEFWPDSLVEQCVPVLYRGLYSHDIVEKYMSGNSVLNEKTIREGVVIKPEFERYNERLHGRMILKAVSPEYLEGKKRK